MSELPDGWALSDIGTVCQYIQRGKSPKYDKKKQTYPIINQKCIRWNEIQSQHLKFVTTEFWKGIDDIRFLQKGDILWNSTGTGTIGRAALFKGLLNYPKIIVDSHVTILRPHLGVNSKYLHYWIQSSNIQNKIEDMQTGTTNQVELSKRVIQVAPIYLAPEDEQRRIAKKLDQILEEVNSVKSHLDKIPITLKNFRQSLIDQYIKNVDFDEKTEKIDLQNVCHSISDGDHQAPPKVEHGIPFLVISNITKGKVDLHGVNRFVPEEYYNNIKNIRIPKKGDILYSVTGSIGISVIVDIDKEFCFQRHIAIIKPDNDLVLTKFLHYYLKSSFVLKQAESVASGTAQITIPLRGLRSFQVKIPSFDVQEEIVKLLDKGLKLANQIEEKYNIVSEQIEKITQSVLAKAFRGELVLQNSNEEPASVLLKRIKLERTEIEKRKKETKKTVRKRKSRESKKMIIPVIEVLLNSNKALSAQELFVAAGYPNNSSTELIEDFFMDIRQALESPKMECQRIENEDFFKIVG